MVSFIHWLLYPRENNPLFILNRKPGGPQYMSKLSREGKDLLLLLGIEPQFIGVPDRSLATIPFQLPFMVLLTSSDYTYVILEGAWL
jgi:hypothetical protein